MGGAELPPPPHAVMPMETPAKSRSMPSHARQLRRRRAGMPKSTSSPRAVSPAAYQFLCEGASGFSAEVVVGVVMTVSVAVTAAAPLTVTGVVEPKLTVG